MGSEDLVTRLLAAIAETEKDPKTTLIRCAADREIVDMYAGTVKIRDDALAEMNGGANTNHRSLDTWSRATYEASVLLPVIEALAEGYDLTTTEVPDGHHDH